MLIRKADIKDCSELSNVAYESKAHWGYSEDFMTQCKDDLTITEEDVKEKLTYLVEDNSHIVGFYCLCLFEQSNSSVGDLEALFIRPSGIGKGFGKMLWEDIVSRAKKHNVSSFKIDSDPYAENFYIRMGARRIGEVNSTVFSDRKLPLLEYVIPVTR
ncbi:MULTISPECIES: GNAT family N-acetyltransferase [Bacillaceae]|uniref:GNAT family N-acetyltransferase n=1 Tax=Evansella alkalicola TaxID=745819 RepID=A0ABS6JXB2_9BACI|nr:MULTISPECIES: GNAT family N-acetyltransferase [Bacillaceae]MBU9722731.1 GNAT family N-acetyltransferase [Bacillus alkalicola]